MKKVLLVIWLLWALPTQLFAGSISVDGLVQKDDLPSASASYYLRDKLYVAGDDSPAIYVMDIDFNILNSETIYTDELLYKGRVKGDEKFDLEGANLFQINGRSTLVFLGSGTGDKREKALLYSLEDKKIEWKNTKPFYRYLRKVANLTEKEFINLEGVTSTDSHVFLFSRGSWGPNLIFTLDRDHFVEYLAGKREKLEQVRVQRVKLPSLQGVKATFSGATYHAPSNSVFITASVGDSDSDKILGSYLLRTHLDSLLNTQTVDLSHNGLLIELNGESLASKVESVVITGQKNGSVTGILSADNDDGTSQFMHFEMQLSSN